MFTKLLVTGAPGNVGNAVVAELRRLNVLFRVGAYRVESAYHHLGSNIEIVPFNFVDPQTYAAAFAGVERLFLVRPPALANTGKEIAPALHAAVQAGVKHIVFLSLQGVEHNRMTPHFKIETFIRELGVAYTFLRASFFMQNLTTTHCAEIRERNEIAVPVGKALTSFIDVRDIGAVAARVLTEPGHENKVYTLTGAQALDYYQVANKLSTVLGRKICYTNPSVLTFVRQQVTDGRELNHALIMAALYTITRFGNAKDVTNDVRDLLRREPISFDQFAADHRAAWGV